MSNRGAEETAGATGGDAGERRGGAGQRVHFEALVAVADTGGGSGFEAESVDVSPGGMRLRTAYLPQIGEKLVCRFDNAGSELVTDGEVIWRNEQARGGEFGLRFVDLTRETAESVHAMCASMTDDRGDHGSAQASAGNAARGTRVRLHIDGLGSPMKARVRESVTGEVLVGSNLEFLRVGRTLELEDVDRGVRRDAHIDHVKVEIDPATNVPQLVVTLRYDDGKKASSGAAAKTAAVAAAATMTLPSPKPQPSARISAQAQPQVQVQTQTQAQDSEEQGEESPAPAVHAPESRASRSEISAAPRRSLASKPAENAASEDEGEREENETLEEGEAQGAGLRGLSAKATLAGKAVASKVGPSLSAVSSKAKSAVAGLLAAVQKKRAERAESQQGSTPRRMTAPPPTGALRSEGRRVIRDDSEDAEQEGEAPKNPKKAALLGSALGLFAVLAVFGVARMLGLSRPADPTATTGADGQAVAALPAGSADPQAAAAPGTGTTDGTTDPGAAAAGTAGLAALNPAGANPAGAPTVLTANVPLFGVTPLSTTEPVPSMPPDAAALAAGMPGAMPGAPGAMPGAPGAMPGDPMAAPGGGSALNDSGSGDLDDSGDDEGGATKKQWGQGSVHNPVVLRIKMDGPVEGLNGAAGAMGFTISLPGRRSLSSTSELARKDKRIASLQVVNNAHGAEVTVQFKDGVPPYMAKAKGDRLEIALGTEGGGHAKKKVAAKASDKKSKDAKKSATGKNAKAKDKKKKSAKT